MRLAASKYVLIVGMAIVLAAATPVPPSAKDAMCGSPDMPCSLEDGEYYAVLPEAASERPAIIWLHGFGRSGKTMIQNPAYVDPFVRRGFAVIMPSGQPGVSPESLDWGVATASN